ncbi:GGDEF domain-containing protein [Litchfieldia alkalitelluris]|uniref:GGDEF domain-containing protein n=1 Tax=Litchfieldia alkalitelluris TaxID=304268 RepID=UPI00099867BF|nr:GGDEF domain-containing protein [Litchfieldia alkalitelluris]
MKKKHPLRTYVFTWACNLIALTITIFHWGEGESLTEFVNYTTIIWLILICLARHGGLFNFVDSKISAGLACVVEFAALVVLPFPLFALSILVSCVVIIADRIRKRHPEPFLGPDINASNVIISGFIGMSVFQVTTEMFPDSEFFFSIALFVMASLYGTFQILIVNTLICLDEKISWLRGPAIQKSTVLTEGILVITGSLLAVTYLYNSYLLLFFIIPALLLQKLLQNANKAQLIYIDEKTGIYNYRYFDEKINEQFLKSKRQGEDLSLIFGDMDYLRDINNNYGHSLGDEAISAIGQVFKKGQEGKYISARFGGEEFVMILPETDIVRAKQVAEEIRKEVEHLDLKAASEEKVSLTISLGVASYPKDARDIQTLIQFADEALYEAKRLGRNRVCQYSDDFKELSIEQGRGNDVKVN